VHNLYNEEGLLTKKFWNFGDKTNIEKPPYGLALSEKLPRIVEYTINEYAVTTDGSIALKLLEEYIPKKINDGFIPFEKAVRKRIYDKAFKELEQYMHDSNKYYEPLVWLDPHYDVSNYCNIKETDGKFYGTDQRIDVAFINNYGNTRHC
jgi:hypothetical protein